MVIDPTSFFFGIVLTLYVIKVVKFYKEAPTDDHKGGVEHGSHLARK